MWQSIHAPMTVIFLMLTAMHVCDGSGSTLGASRCCISLCAAVSSRSFAMGTFVLMVWLSWVSSRDPEPIWAPGQLSRYHADVARCTSCHEPFRGHVNDKCTVCYPETDFSHTGKQLMATLHQDVIRERQQKTCLACHTEHRGSLAQITRVAMSNPHGEFAFRSTRSSSCMTSHEFATAFGVRPILRDNETVRRLLTVPGGAHRLGQMARCLTCHVADRK